MGQIRSILRALASDGRWRRSLALVVVFAIGCGLLSWWQFARRQETAQAQALISANASAPATSIGALLADRGAWSADDEWRTVRLQGEYLPAEQLLVRNRVDPDGDPGFEVLTPFRLGDGDVFVLDRGWISIGTTQDRPDSVPAAPDGSVVVDARLQQDEGPLPGRTAPSGEIPSIDLKAVAKRTGADTYTGAYGQVRTETPAVALGGLQRLTPSVDTGVDEGTHLSYAIQWILFAAIAFGALGWSIRRDLRDAGDEHVLASDARAAVRRAKRAPSDESAEDALLDR